MTHAAEREPLLVVDDLRTSFHLGGRSINAVNGVSFTLDRGATLGIVGESGSGKSVMARAVMGLLADKGAVITGSVRFNGTELIGATKKQLRPIWGPGIAMVFQDPLTSLNPVMKVGPQITEAIRAHERLRRSDAADRAVALLDMVHVPESSKRMTQFPHELSGGMRQRVAIAIALASKPRLLLADEPTTALDVTIQAEILDLLEDLKDTLGMSLILISHDLSVVASRTDEVAVMYAGKIVEQGRTEDVFAATQMPYTTALLAAIPRLDRPSHTRLFTIEGRPPDPASLHPGCSFAARCPRATSRCLTEAPVLDLRPGSLHHHRFACWHPTMDDAEVPERQPAEA
jgi:peptide/nickel transport system ATP-binding protein